MYISSNETKLLLQRFDMMEAYLGRYCTNFILAVMTVVYEGNLAMGELDFNNYVARATSRIEKISNLHNKARKSMFALKFDFDSAEIVIPDLATDNRTVSFTHAQLIVFLIQEIILLKALNTMSEAISYGDYDTVKICVDSPQVPMCKRILSLIDLTFKTIFNSMSKQQNYVVKIMESELLKLATNGENIQYIIYCICSGLVIICLIVIIPVFSWVIQDKSYVFAIFSDIEQSEINEVISDCKKLDIRHLQFKKKWISKYDNKPKEFWNRVNNSSDSENKHEKKETKKSFQLSSAVCEPEKGQPQPDTKKQADDLIISETNKLKKRELLSEVEYFF